MSKKISKFNIFKKTLNFDFDGNLLLKSEQDGHLQESLLSLTHSHFFFGVPV